MKSKWVEYNGKSIFYQDFSNHFFNEQAVIEELKQVQEIVLSQPEYSLLVISNFSNTEITSSLMPILNESSSKTKSHVRKTAVLGVTGIKRALGDLLSRITGQELMYFSNEMDAKEWLTKE
ncbi:MAG TPA: hypothetical protein PK152_12730 [Anaerolineales bacterium]|nr:hypothetical protein [Anaerolineae bacterium]HRJ56634.1 hypothetical protein [Anaerolineales bacterium]HRK89993.1 hypothetical protein [Anaerolineales bacterium]